MSETNNLMNQKALQEEYEDIKIKLLMTRFAELEGKKLIEENEELSKESFYLPSAKEKQRFIRRLNFHFTLFNFKRVAKRLFHKRFRKIAIFTPVFLILLLTTFLSVEAFRVKLLNLYIQIEKEYTTIRLEEEMNQLPVHLQIEWNNAYVPTKVPEGYHITGVSSNQNIKSIEYENESQGFIMFQQNNRNSGINVDTEGADEVSRLTLHGHDGLFVHKKDVMTVVWKDEAHLFLILGSSTDLSKEEMIEMAQSVTLIK
ncbi:hypothetical protein PACILC2_19700 [Paenibacillus cisolokensis]|jgi:hypothetical protein|uniref:DUF4367 domain-containing protein n=1 Tax=Paenibacillus cisolokensis TaxID=1658519 RepID=A0ABQ4N5F5_9BACL|nr:DUF4367 domain-containing protein [Paenibacillus cisolokensis]GIQ63402.1 hypothetical protein PACILC2_19700 [Paenibacillus cisolokensis]